MARIKVPQRDGEITLYFGHETKSYSVTDGAIVADDGHVIAILTSVPGSELAPEAPAKKEK